MLIQRLITACILIPLVLFILFYLPPWAFTLLISIVTIGALWEWTNLMQIQRIMYRLLYLLFAFLIFFDAAIFIPLNIIFIVGFVFWLFALLLVLRYPNGSSWWGKSVIWRGLMGIFVLFPCWTALNYLCYQNDGVYILLYLFVLIWGADSAAYFIGKQWGKTKLAPNVSPGKSWQGFIAAMLFTLLFATVGQWLADKPLNLWGWGILISLFTTLFSIVGDLFESMLKRQAGLKDSGSLLPGHGGILDRIDSLTAGAPIFALGPILLGMYLS